MKLRDKRDVKGLIQALKDPKKGNEAFEALKVIVKRHMRNWRVRKHIIPLLREIISPQYGYASEMREFAVKALGKHRVRSEVATLINVLKADSSVMRMEAIRALGLIGTNKAVAAVVDVLRRDDNGGHNEKDAYVRMTAVSTLSTLKSEHARFGIWEALRNDTSAQVRIVALKALARIDAKRYKRSIFEAAKNSDYPDVQLQALRLISGMKKNDEVFNVVDHVAFHSRDPMVRLEAVKSLAEFNDFRAVSLIALRLRDDNNVVSNTARAKLIKMARRSERDRTSVLNCIKYRLKFWKQNVSGVVGKRELIQCLKLVASGAIIDVDQRSQLASYVIDIFNSAKDMKLKIAAVRALGILATGEAVASLLKAAGKLQSGIRRRADEKAKTESEEFSRMRNADGVLPSRKRVKAFRQLARQSAIEEDSQRPLLEAVIRALGRCGDTTPHVIRALKSALTFEAWSVRKAAALALANRDDYGIIADLRAAVNVELSHGNTENAMALRKIVDQHKAFMLDAEKSYMRYVWRSIRSGTWNRKSWAEKMECLSILGRMKYSKDDARKLLVHIAMNENRDNRRWGLALNYMRKGYPNYYASLVISRPTAEGALHMLGLPR